MRSREELVLLQAVVWEFFSKGCDQRFSDVVFLVVFLEVITLGVAGVSANGADVDHAVAKFDKGPAHDWEVEFRDMPKDEFGQLLVLLLS